MKPNESVQDHKRRKYETFTTEADLERDSGLFAGDVASAQSSYDLQSPDKQIEVRIRTAHGVHYDVLLNGRILMQDSTLSMDVDHKVLGREVKVSAEKERHSDQVLEPVVRQKFAKIRENYNELRLDMEGAYPVVQSADYIAVTKGPHLSVARSRHR